MEEGGFKEGLKDYARCVAANKATLAGYVGGALSIGMILCSSLSPEAGRLEEWMAKSAAGTVAYCAIECLPLIASPILLIKTALGLETLESYRKTRQAILEQEPSRLRGGLKRYYRSSEYCSQAGVRLALQESGIRLEEILEN